MNAEQGAGRPVLDVAQVAELEQRIAAAGTSLADLMDRAGAAVADAALEAAGRMRDEPPRREGFAEPASGLRVTVLCGSGNNGGDGWVAARLLAQRGCAVRVVTSRIPDQLTAQPAHDAAVRARDALEACERARIVVAPGAEDTHLVEDVLSDADVVVDAILGTGFSGESVRAPYDEWIRLANARRGAGARIVAADVPSGLSAQTGAAAAPCIEADLTVTMIVGKTGMAVPQAACHCGEVRVAPLAPIDGLLEGLE